MLLQRSLAFAHIGTRHLPMGAKLGTAYDCVKRFKSVDIKFTRCPVRPIKERFMLHYSVVFLVIALIAAVFGFGGIAAGAVEIAKILFVIFAVMAVVSFVVSLIKKN